MSKQPNRKWRPYVMRGQPTVTEFRSTADEPPDRRVAEVTVPSLPAEKVRAFRKKVATDPRLRAVDLCFERWAVTPTGNNAGIGFSHVILLAHEPNGTAPLDDLQSKIIDAAVRASPIWAQRFVHLWYRAGESVSAIADVLAMKRKEYVYEERERVLFYYSGRLHEIGFSLTVDDA